VALALSLAPAAARAETPRESTPQGTGKGRQQAARENNESPLVSTAWLAQHLNDPGLVLFHMGPDADYPAQHIPGARLLQLRAISNDEGAPGALTLEMSSPEKLHAQLEAVGISDDSRIVVYGASDWISAVTRAIFTFLYAGLENVSMLDGGLEAWKKEGRELTAVIPPATPGKLSPLKMTPLLADAAFVQSHAHMPEFVVVDARDTSFYDGTQERSGTHMPGHIRGATSVPFRQLNGDDLKWKPAAELEAIFAKAGVKPADTVIGYCHIGQQATVLLFAARSLGHRVLLYDGSSEDWARRALPVDNPAKK
jgi:thiosulfate/3-mercaptopyruvate sulfurtransferase